MAVLSQHLSVRVASWSRPDDIESDTVVMCCCMLDAPGGIPLLFIRCPEMGAPATSQN